MDYTIRPQYSVGMRRCQAQIFTNSPLQKWVTLTHTLAGGHFFSESSVITSNLPFAKWNTIFKDDMSTAAAIDRLVHHSVILKLNAESYRKEVAKSKLESNEEVVMSA